MTHTTHGLPEGDRRSRTAAKQVDMHQITGHDVTSVAVAYAMRAGGVDHRTVWQTVGEDADRLALVVQNYDRAQAHLRDLGLRGAEPLWVTWVRDMSRRCWP